LEGPYDATGDSMYTALNENEYLPLSQPFDSSTWSYSGTENVSIVPSDIVDWILLELRTGSLASTIQSRRAAFLRSDGLVVDLDGTSEIHFDNVKDGNYYVVIHHRNHLSVMTTSSISLTSGSSTEYDFTTALSQYYGGEAKLLASGVYGIYSGDSNQDGNVTVSDNNLVMDNRNDQGYEDGDSNIDGNVTVSDNNMTISNVHASIANNGNYILTAGRAGTGSQCYIALAYDNYGGGTNWYPPLNSWELLFVVSLPIANALENSGLAWHETSTGFSRGNNQPLTAVLSVNGEADISLADPSGMIVTENTELPDNYQLYQNFPNPFNPSTQIVFDIPISVVGNTEVMVIIYNSMGQVVRRLYSGKVSAGKFNLIWDGKSDHGVQMASGIYLTKIVSKNYIHAIKMTLLK